MSDTTHLSVSLSSYSSFYPSRCRLLIPHCRDSTEKPTCERNSILLKLRTCRAKTALHQSLSTIGMECGFCSLGSLSSKPSSGTLRNTLTLAPASSLIASGHLSDTVLFLFWLVWIRKRWGLEVHLQVPALDMLARIQQAIPQLNDSWSNIHISYVGDILYRDRAFLNRIQADRGQIFSYLKVHGTLGFYMVSATTWSKAQCLWIHLVNLRWRSSMMQLFLKGLIICIYSPLLNNPRYHAQLPPPIPAQFRPAMRW